MKKIFLVLVTLFITASLFAGDFSDKKMAVFFNSLKKGQYEKGIVELLSNSVLEDKIVNVPESLSNWIGQFTQIRSLYGDYLSYDKAAVIKLSSIEETTYFVNCTDYPIRIVMTEYNNGQKTQLINLYFDDSTLESLDYYGEVE